MFIVRKLISVFNLFEITKIIMLKKFQMIFNCCRNHAECKLMTNWRELFRCLCSPFPTIFPENINSKVFFFEFFAKIETIITINLQPIYSNQLNTLKKVNFSFTPILSSSTLASL